MRNPGIFRLFFVFVCFLSTSFAANANRDNVSCGIVPGQPLTNAYGPWDFTNPSHSSKIPIVLKVHFTAEVERLISGATGSLMHDLDYTLRAVPNYHRALHAVAKFYRSTPNSHDFIGKYWTTDCYFKRAIYFQPKDATSRMLFASHLHLSEKHESAEKEYQAALQIQPYNVEIHYNLGLLYVDMDRIADAEKHAKIAYDNGFPLDGLKNKIQRAKKSNS